MKLCKDKHNNQIFFFHFWTTFASFAFLFFSETSCSIFVELDIKSRVVGCIIEWNMLNNWIKTELEAKLAYLKKKKQNIIYLYSYTNVNDRVGIECD